MSDTKRIVVTLGTGKQGSAVVRALAALNTPVVKYTILAVTRNSTSKKAVELAALPGVELLESPYVASEIMQKALKGGPVYGVFSAQQSIDNADGGVAGEKKQGIELSDEAAKAGVKHFVYTSVDFGGPEQETGIEHFDSKSVIEKHIKTAHPTLPLTILRPVFFADNIGDDVFIAKLFAAAVNSVVKGKLKIITCHDIGRFAALAFDQPETWIGKELNIAGDAVTAKELSAQYKEVKGKDLPATFGLLGFLFVKAIPQLRYMFNFFNKPGFEADVEECRKILPDLQTWKVYVQEQL